MEDGNICWNKFLHEHQKSHVTLNYGKAEPDKRSDRSRSTASEMLWSFSAKKKRTAKYERILNFLALVAQNQQPCRSKRLALTHRYTNKQTHIHKQTYTAEGGRADQRGVQMDGESLSVPTPSRVICCPICTLTARPPNPRDAHTHTLAYTRTCIPYLSPHVSWVWHTNFPHPLCSHADAGHLYISLECVWTVCSGC